jgi:hypothetical protein
MSGPSLPTTTRLDDRDQLRAPRLFCEPGREYAERAAYLARFQTDSTTTPCPIDATGLVYRSSSPANVYDRTAARLGILKN